MIYPLKHGSLFSGIDGFGLAAEIMNWENVFHCEINNYLTDFKKKNTLMLQVNQYYRHRFKAIQKYENQLN